MATVPSPHPAPSLDLEWSAAITDALGPISLAPPVSPCLGLTQPDLEELLAAVAAREDQALCATMRRARLARGRQALERELARLLAQ